MPGPSFRGNRHHLGGGGSDMLGGTAVAGRIEELGRGTYLQKLVILRVVRCSTCVCDNRKF